MARDLAEGPSGGRNLIGLGLMAVAYVAADVAREHATWMPHQLSDNMQPALWGCLAILALFEAPRYAHWGEEIRALPRFLACCVFMVAAIMMEVVLVQFVTAVLGIDWHRSTPPLPDTWHWVLLALNESLPWPITALLRMHLIELHHYLMLFVMLAFSVLFNCIQPPGFGIAARYCLAMGIGRILRFLTFTATILPSARPWCAEARFGGSVPSFPHPWAQKFYVPYSTNHDMIATLLQKDECFAPPLKYPPEYRPNWGLFQFMANFLRPMDPSLRSDGSDKSFVIRPGGGCNDLAFSGHILVAVLTACAWQEAFPGWTSAVIWFLAFHSGQREIRERQHYSLDVVAGFYVGFLLWRWTSFMWSNSNRRNGRVSENLARDLNNLRKSAKEGDLDSIRKILDDAESDVRDVGRTEGSYTKLMGFILVLFGVSLALTAFLMNVGG